SPISISIGFGIMSFLITDFLIPKLKQNFTKIGLCGKDLSKKDKPILPESIGIITASTYLIIMFLFIPFLFSRFLVTSTSGGGNRDDGYFENNINNNSNITYTTLDKFSHVKLTEYLAALLSLMFMVLLGIADDLFDIRWRTKFPLPIIGAIPLLVVYYVDFGVTSILLPNFLKSFFNSTTINLGVFYYIYMGSVAVFCPNSINILAGVNGLEVFQCVILSVIFLINDFCYLISSNFPQSKDSHLFSIVLIIPFLGSSMALLKYNWYPAKVFVGDTYCYFGGMLFAIVGILGHFSKTALLFFLPQIFNFVYSVPQLFGLIPCPRHRLPNYSIKDGLMYPSFTDLNYFKIIEKVLYILSYLRLLRIEEKTVNNEKHISRINNLTLINLTLIWFGPMREDRLCLTICGLQFVIGILALIGRHTLGPWLYGFDNL
ncbi:UDP-N-acetylglucosamine--dolichyl-phosphate N-acetylglucosaminephosphotransferase ASCRUDRAFT_25371, partial [Ascoidea rubescens DSM 1968]